MWSETAIRDQVRLDGLSVNRLTSGVYKKRHLARIPPSHLLSPTPPDHPALIQALSSKSITMISATFTSFRNWATAIITPSAPLAPLSRSSPSAALIQPASPPITEISIEAPAQATRCTSDDTTAFDLLFAVYHLHYLESEQKYKTWRRDPRATHQTETYTHTHSTTVATLPVEIHPATAALVSTPTEAATVDDDYDVAAEPESEALALEDPVSPQYSVFSNFEDDAYDSEESSSSTCTSAMSEESANINDEITSFKLSFSPTFNIGLECRCSSPEPVPTSSGYIGRIASAIPRHITTENYATPKPDLSRWVRAADLDIVDDYDVRCLTPQALEEAELRSRDLRRYARMVAADLRESSGSKPLKAGEHPEPKGMLRPSMLGDLGRRSRLRQSWAMSDAED